MRPKAAEITELLALAAIAVTIGFGGRALLAQLHLFAVLASAVLAAGLLTILRTMRRRYSAGATRLEFSRLIAYATAIMLVLWAVLFPASWVTGAAIAMLEIALVFDIFSRLSALRGAQETRP